MDKALLVTSFLILIVTLIKCVFLTTRAASEIYLCITLISLLIISMILYLVTTGKIMDFIHLYRFGALSTYIFVASSFLYIKKSISKGVFSASDLLFYLPAFLYLLDFLPFFLQSAEYKRASFTRDMGNKGLNAFRQGWMFPAGYHFVLQNLYGVALSIAQFVLLNRMLREKGKAFYAENKTLINWFFVWAFLLFMACFPDLLSVFTGHKAEIFRLWYLSPCMLVNLIYPLSLLISPKILYGVNGEWTMQTAESVPPDNTLQLNQFTGTETVLENAISLNAAAALQQAGSGGDAVDAVLEKEENPGRKLYYQLEDAESIKEKMDAFMLDSKAFRDQNYSINLLAKDLGCSVRLVSSLLNAHFGISFKDYINTFRIQYFIDQFNTNPEAIKITMEGLAKDSGFNSRFTFIHAFKKNKGKTPSEYFGINS